MAEFRIEGDALRREVRFRRLSWGTVLALSAVMAFLVLLRCSGLKFGLGLIWLLSVSFFLVFFGSCILAFREALSAAERQMIFTLDGKGITRNRRGYPPVRIAFSEIDYLEEEMKWLIVMSSEPRRKIAVPKKIEGYELVRAELSKHHPFSPAPRLPLQSAAMAVISLAAWAAVLWPRDVRIVIPCGVIALTLLAIGSQRLCVGLVWIAAILLICVRSLRP